MKYCRNPECGKLLVRGIGADGSPERPIHFRNRRYCNMDCYQATPVTIRKSKKSNLTKDQKAVMSALLGWR